jgi:sugar phosphate isomerase/epimerase
MAPHKISPPDPALLSLNTATVRERWSLREMIQGCARHGIRGISPWRDKLGELGAKDAARLVRDNGLTVTGLCRGGMFPAADRKGRQAALDDNLRALEQAAVLGARCLVLVVGGLPTGSKDLGGAREMVRDGIGELLDRARGSGVPLAIEPLHPMYCADRACVNTLAQALDLCDVLDTGKGGALGVAVDVYHVWWDPALRQQIERAGDWLVPTVDLLNDRGMMGDGVIDLPLVRSWMEAAGYRGYHEVEIFSASNWWKREPDDVLGIIKRRHQEYC